MNFEKGFFEDQTANPVLIFGTGRCGSSIFYRVLAAHPETSFISNLNVRFPDRIFPHKLNYLAGKYLLRKGVVSPSEAYPLLNKIYPGYRRPMRNLEAFDVTERVKEGFRDFFREVVRKQKGNLALYKYTGWSRIGFFKEIFPEAIFVHVIRDGRAVANSMVDVPWWDGFQGPYNWRWGPLPEDYRKELERHGKSFLVLAAIEWKMLLDEYENSLESLGEEQRILIKYEDFVEAPEDNLEKVIDKTCFDWNKRFRSRVENHNLYNANYKWKENLNKVERNRLNEVLEDRLEQYGYSAEGEV